MKRFLTKKIFISSIRGMISITILMLRETAVFIDLTMP